MPKLTMDDVDKEINEILKPKPQGNTMLEKLREVARKTRGLKPPIRGVR